MSALKANLCSLLQEQLATKIEFAHRAVLSAKESRDNETKSSAGDKYETAREMMQFEIDKQTAHLHQLKLLQTELSRVNVEKAHAVAAFGSVVCTTNGNYFLSVSLGKLVLDGEIYYALSLASPLGKVLLNKSEGDTFNFQGKEIEVKSLL